MLLSNPYSIGQVVIVQLYLKCCSSNLEYDLVGYSFWTSIKASVLIFPDVWGRDRVALHQLNASHLMQGDIHALSKQKMLRADVFVIEGFDVGYSL
ncbi:MAG: hypothetical protein AAF685_00640 [Cyanobacteria bacterium P01_C01_bin.89]